MQYFAAFTHGLRDKRSHFCHSPPAALHPLTAWATGEFTVDIVCRTLHALPLPNWNYNKQWALPVKASSKPSSTGRILHSELTGAAVSCFGSEPCFSTESRGLCHLESLLFASLLALPRCISCPEAGICSALSHLGACTSQLISASSTISLTEPQPGSHPAKEKKASPANDLFLQVMVLCWRLSPEGKLMGQLGAFVC